MRRTKSTNRARYHRRQRTLRRIGKIGRVMPRKFAIDHLKKTIALQGVSINEE